MVYQERAILGENLDRGIQLLDDLLVDSAHDGLPCADDTDSAVPGRFQCLVQGESLSFVDTLIPRRFGDMKGLLLTELITNGRKGCRP